MDVDLAAVVAAWCEPRRVRVLRDDGHAVWATIPPLVDLLLEAVASNGAGDQRRTSSGGSPIDLDVLDILDGLRVTIADWRGRAGLQPRPGLAAGVRQIAAHPWPPDDGQLLGRVLTALAGRAEEYLTPPDVAPERHVRDTPCPDCGAWTVPVTNSFGEPGTAPALLVVLNRGLVRYVTCQACGREWDRSVLEAWARRVPA
jgi:hypothetical protein